MRRINPKMLAAALIAVQIAVTATPAAALACENEEYSAVVEETTDQAQAEVTEDITESVGTAATSAAAESIGEEPEAETEEEPAAEATEEPAAEATVTPAAEETEEPAAEETEEPAAEATEEPAADRAEESSEETEDEMAVEASEEIAGEATDVNESETANEAAGDAANEAAGETAKHEEQSAKSGKAFAQSVTVDNVKVTVTAEEGTFAEGAKLSVTRVPSTQLKEVENAIADARAKDTDAAFAYTFDIKILGDDGKTLNPAAGKTVRVAFESNEMAENSLKPVVYHIVKANDNITAKKLATTVNRNEKTAEAQADGFSFYAVEFYRVDAQSADQNKTDPEQAAKKENTDEDNKKSGKTETDTDNNTKPETVNPASKGTVKDETSRPAVKEEVKKETSVSEAKKETVKKETKSETKKKETVKAKKKSKKENNKDNKKEETKKKTDAKKSPKTGDENEMLVWLVLSFLATGGVIGLILFRRDRDHA